MHEEPQIDNDALDRIVNAVSNWSRFGNDDQLGTLNLVDEAAVQRALAAATLGERVSLARRLEARATADNPRPIIHHMLRSGDRSAPGFYSASDWIGLEFHGFGTTHLDALSHVMWNGLLYNGVPASSVTTASGAKSHSVEALSGRLSGRGVLLDLPRSLGVDWVKPGWSIDPDDLDRCCSFESITIRKGDIVLVRFGRDARSHALGAHDPILKGFPGLSASCGSWIQHHDISVLGTDAVADVMVPGGAPHLMPIHVACLVGMGMPLIDNLSLDQLAERCWALRKWTCFVAAEPLPIRGATGSPVAPIAVL